MALTPGTRLGPYEVIASIGVGGMGEVFRARDTKLNREVALKVLPDVFASDPDRLARFTREAQTLASLNHPNIAHIHGLEESTGVRALVMELVEGEDLSQRIARGAIPLDEALPIAKQIAEALEAAHELGIIHRDLKPANVKIRQDGVVKVLDFGLAKAMEPAAAPNDISQSPTITSPAMTQMGMILGTAAYMSPEQAAGKPVDKRTDIWSFGVVLWEMLTGRRLFDGETVSHVLAAVLTKAPDWTMLPAQTPTPIRTLLRRCLEKDRKRRLADASDARLEIEEAPSGSATVDTSAAAPSSASMSRGRLIALAGGAAVLLSVITGAAVWTFTPREVVARATSRFALRFPPGVALIGNATQKFAIARDGRHVVFNGASRSGVTQLYVRPVDQLDAVPIRGIDAVLGGVLGSLFLSPDGEWVGYNDTGSSTLKKIRISGGSPVTVCKVSAGGGGFNGATWGQSGLIVFATTAVPGLMKVPDTGGVPEPLTVTAAADRHVQPRFLPGGHALLFVILRSGAPARIAVLSLATGQITELLDGTFPLYASSGHLLFLREGVMWAVAFDPDRPAVIGTAAPVLEGLATTGGPAPRAQLDVSEDGTLVYSAYEAAAERTLVWVDRQGREEPIPNVPPRAYAFTRLSPDGRRIALDVRDQDNDILTWDLDRSVLTRITLDRALDRNPVWTLDGTRIAFWSSRTEPGGIFWQAADGTGTPERLLENRAQQIPMAFARDGRLILRQDGSEKTGSDLMVLAPDAPRRLEPLFQTEAVETNAEPSWDGRWLAYQVGNTIWVSSFPDVTKGRWQVSPGTQPLWSRDGRELFFLGADGRLMRVAVQTSPTFTTSAPVPVLERAYVWSGIGLSARTYDVSPDGRRFLMIKAVETPISANAPELVAVVNWFEELRKKVPASR